MSIFDNPVKAKNLFGIFLAISIVLFIGLGTAGYFYYLKYQENKVLSAKVWELEGSTTSASYSAKQSEAELKKQISDLQKDKTDLAKENKTLTDQATATKTKIDKALAYNQVFVYLNSLVVKYSGLDNWTEADYQAGLVKVRATEDKNLENTVDWAWHDSTVDDLTRALSVWQTIANGVENSLK